MENSNIISFYNSFKDRQNRVGVNTRHLYILKHLIKYGLKDSGNILEIGCGIGTLTSLLVEYLKSGSILANDLSNESIDIARSRLGKYSNIHFHSGNISNLEANSKYDAVILADVIEHIPIEQHHSLFKQLKSLLRKSGKIFINIPNPSYLEWCKLNIPERLQIVDQPIHINDLSVAVYKNGLKLTQLVTYSVWIKECDYQFMVIEHNESLKSVEEITYNKQRTLGRFTRRIIQKWSSI